MTLKTPDCFYCRKRPLVQMTRYKDFAGVSTCGDDECFKKAIDFIKEKV